MLNVLRTFSIPIQLMQVFFYESRNSEKVEKLLEKVEIIFLDKKCWVCY